MIPSSLILALYLGSKPTLQDLEFEPGRRESVRPSPGRLPLSRSSG